MSTASHLSAHASDELFQIGLLVAGGLSGRRHEVDEGAAERVALAPDVGYVGRQELLHHLAALLRRRLRLLSGCALLPPALARGALCIALAPACFIGSAALKSTQQASVMLLALSVAGEQTVMCPCFRSAETKLECPM